MVNNRGRPPGTSTARRRLLDAARQHLYAGDLAQLSSRQLAAEVGVSHSLVNYHFGSRDALAATAASLHARPDDVVAMARGSDGGIHLPRLAQGLVAVWEHPEHGARLTAFARRLAGGGDAARPLTQYLEHTVFEALTADFGRTRARRMAVSIIGFVFGRYVLGIPTLTALRREEAARLLLSLLR